MNLFQHGAFTLPSGRVSNFKIECDELSEKDWETFARVAVTILPPFHTIEGVPQGGLPFAEALKPYTSTEGGLLIVDDVWVTGKSMEAYRNNRPAFGIVAFTRGQLPSWVQSIFKLNFTVEKATYSEDND